jgi:hypothetical protein
VEGSREHGDEPPGSIKCWEVLEWLQNWQLLKKGSAPWVSEMNKYGNKGEWTLVTESSGGGNMGSLRSTSMHLMELLPAWTPWDGGWGLIVIAALWWTNNSDAPIRNLTQPEFLPISVHPKALRNYSCSQLWLLLIFSFHLKGRTWI